MTIRAKWLNLPAEFGPRKNLSGSLGGFVFIEIGTRMQRIMQKGELLRVVDSIHRDKEIDKEVLFSSIEQAMATAARKQYGKHSDVQVKIDRETGEISAACIHGDIPVAELGRIAAQIAKQVIIQKVREAERDVIHGEFEQKIGTIVSGSIQRFEKGSIIVNLGKTEGLIPRKEQVPSENFRPGDQIKGVLTEVRKNGQQNRIIISRTHPDFVRRLLENERLRCLVIRWP